MTLVSTMVGTQGMITDPTGYAQRFLNSCFPAHTLFPMSAKSEKYLLDEGIAPITYPAPPPLRINQLYFPMTGLGRSAQVVTLGRSPMDLGGNYAIYNDSVGNFDSIPSLPSGRLQTSNCNFALEGLGSRVIGTLPLPEQGRRDEAIENMYLIPQTDRRHFLQFKSHISVFTNTSTWAYVISQLMREALPGYNGWDGVVPEVDAKYLLPDFRLLNRLQGKCGIGTLIDLVLHSVGMRVCVKIVSDNEEAMKEGYGPEYAYFIQKLSDAADTVDANFRNGFAGTPRVTGQPAYRDANSIGEFEVPEGAYLGRSTRSSKVSMLFAGNINFIHRPDLLMKWTPSTNVLNSFPVEVYTRALHKGLESLGFAMPQQLIDLSEKLNEDEMNRSARVYDITMVAPYKWETSAFDDSITIWHARESDFTELDLGPNDPGVMLMRINSVPWDVMTSVQLSRWANSSFTIDDPSFLGVTTSTAGISSEVSEVMARDYVAAKSLPDDHYGNTDYFLISDMLDDEGNPVYVNALNPTSSYIIGGRACVVSRIKTNWVYVVESCP